MTSIWKVRLVESTSVFLSATQSLALNGVITTTEDKWKGWSFVEGPVALEITPPTKFATLKVPYSQLYMLIVREVPEPATEPKAAAKK